MLLVASCTKEEKTSDTNINCINMEANPNFPTEAFKDVYTIQFPSEYTGDGLATIYSYLFKQKNRSITLITNDLYINLIKKKTNFLQNSLIFICFLNH